MTGPGTASPWLTCEIVRDFAAVPAGLDCFCERLAEERVNAEAIDELRLAVTEGVTNAIEHGGGDDPIRLEWRWAGEMLEIRISEAGTFEPDENWGRLPSDELSEGGRGGFLIHQLTDEVRHENVHGRHTLRLWKRVGRTVAPDSTAELEQTLEAMTEELSQSYESLSALFSFSESIATAGRLDDFFATIFERVANLVPFDLAVVRFAGADQPGGLRRVHVRGASDPELPEIVAIDRSTAEGRAFVDRNEQTIENCSSLKDTDPLRGSAGCAFVCPVAFQTRRTGVLSIVRRQAGADYFPNVQLALIRTVADFIGIAQANSEAQEQRRRQERTMRELEIARQIQFSLLPTRFPARADWRVHGVCRNATEVGGDFFDVIELPGRGLLLLIADVMGKGVPAALLATVLRTAVRARADLMADPGPLLAAVNAQLAPDLDRVSMFITAQAAFLPEDGAEILFASAGHGPVLVVSGGAASTLGDGGLPLGVSGVADYQTERVACRAGDRLLLVTDGIHETLAPDGAEFGIEGIATTVVGSLSAPADRVCELVLEAASMHGSGGLPADDRTILVAERLLL